MTIASYIGMVLRIMVLMADFTHILATRPDFTESDREWLHHLVADWQVIADLSFADLLLIVQDGDGNYRIVEQCRPSTVMTLRIDDAVGALVAPEMVGELDAAMQSKTVFRSTVLRAVGKSTVCNVYAPIRHDGKTLGLVVRETNMATRESNGRYESESINAGKQLYEMIPRGQFPYVNAIMSQRHVARVSDGFIMLTQEGIVRYASPNAISCFRRLGCLMTMQGHFLSEIGTDLLRRNDPVPEALPMVLMGKDAVDSEINANRSAVSVRSLPLYDNNGRTGAIILCRDVPSCAGVKSNCRPRTPRSRRSTIVSRTTCRRSLRCSGSRRARRSPVRSKKSLKRHSAACRPSPWCTRD